MLIAEHFDAVTVEAYPCDLYVTDVEPIIAALRSLDPLTPREWTAARALVRRRIDEQGGYRIRKHTVLITGSAR
jgi:hypothetical protein